LLSAAVLEDEGEDLMALQKVDIGQAEPALQKIFGHIDALLTSGDRESCNTMTIGWCQTGILWSIPVCTVYVRPERYTYQFMESHDYFTVSVLPADRKQDMIVCGTESGRDVDKIAKCGLTVCYGEGDAPYFAEAEWVLVCRKIYVQDMSGDCALTDEVTRHYGPNNGWHRIYTGRIVEAYKA